jgi:protein required for attachment to host cells
MKTAWVLVADEAIARILERPLAGGDLVPVETLTDADAHAREAEMRHGPHGRRAGGGTAAQATVSASDSERHQHAQLFARRVAERLTRCHAEGRFGQLHLMVAPRLLGYLRKALAPEVAALVGCTLDRDVVQETPRELGERLTASLSGASP